MQNLGIFGTSGRWGKKFSSKMPYLELPTPIFLLTFKGCKEHKG